MPVYKTRTFSRWMKHEGLVDRDLHSAILEMQDGLVDEANCSSVFGYK